MSAYTFLPQHCPTCGPETPSRELGWRGGRYHRYGLGIATRIVRCRGCGLIYPDPFPHATSADALYADPAKYFEHHDEPKKVERQRALLRDLAQRAGSPNPVMLDVGSGRGELLEAAAREGFARIVGLEVAQAMIEHARVTYGAEVLDERIEEHAARAAGRYDVVVLAAVLEHVDDPDSMIKSAAQLLRTGGVLYIDCPNEPNLMTRIGNVVNRLRRRRAVLNLAPTFAPFHVYGFNRRALSRLLGKYAFSVEEVRLWANPDVPAGGGLGDRILSWGASQVLRVGNWVGMAANMEAWARKQP